MRTDCKELDSFSGLKNHRKIGKNSKSRIKIKKLVYKFRINFTKRSQHLQHWTKTLKVDSFHILMWKKLLWNMHICIKKRVKFKKKNQSDNAVIIGQNLLHWG